MTGFSFWPLKSAATNGTLTNASIAVTGPRMAQNATVEANIGS